MKFIADISFWKINEEQRFRKIFINHNSTDIAVISSYYKDNKWKSKFTHLGMELRYRYY